MTDLINLISCFSDNIHLPASSKAWSKPLPSINFPMTFNAQNTTWGSPIRNTNPLWMSGLCCSFDNSFDVELQVKRDNGFSVSKDTILYLLSLFHSCIKVSHSVGLPLIIGSTATVVTTDFTPNGNCKGPMFVHLSWEKASMFSKVTKRYRCFEHYSFLPITTNNCSGYGNILLKARSIWKRTSWTAV